MNSEAVLITRNSKPGRRGPVRSRRSRTARLVVDAALVAFLAAGLLTGALLGEKAAKLTRENRKEATVMVKRLAGEQVGVTSVAGASEFRSTHEPKAPVEDWSDHTASERAWTSALRKVESLDERGSRRSASAHLPPSA